MAQPDAHDLTPRNELEHALADAQAGRVLTEDMLRALVRLPLFVPSRQPVQADGTGLASVVLTQGGSDFVAAFTAPERAGALVGQAGYGLQVAGGDLLARLPTGCGLAVNVGSALGFQIDAAGVQKVRDDLIGAAVGQALPLLQTVALEDHIESLHFTPDGKTLVGGQTHNDVSFWRVSENGVEHRASFPSGLKRLYDVALSSDGARLATAGLAEGDQGPLCTWKMPDGEREQEYSLPDSYLLATAFSPKGERLLAGGDEEELHVINLRTGAIEFAVTDGEEDDDEDFWGLGERNTSIVYHPDGRTVLVTACNQAGSGVMFCEIDTKRDTLIPRSDLTLPLMYDVLSPAAFSPDGHFFAFADWNVNLYSFPERSHIAILGTKGERLTTPAAEPVVRQFWSNALFTPDGRTLLCGSPGGAIFLWDVPSGTLRHTLTGHEGGVLALALGPAGALLASSGYDKTLRLWQLPGEETVAGRGT